MFSLTDPAEAGQEIADLPYTMDPKLINIKRIQTLEDFFYAQLMASSDVDQKYLGQFAKDAGNDNPYLSSMLYKTLGLSVLLSKKLIRARRLRKLDTTRDTKSLQLYHHIIWLSREGLVIVEQYVLPMVADHIGLKVLAYKLRASFYHIFVLFHNQPSINRNAIPGAPGSPKGKGKAADRGSIRSSPVEGVRSKYTLPPGLAPIPIPKPAATFLLPAIDYTPTASTCFSYASTLADSMLPGSHPLRLSVKVEYAAYLYDCLRDGEGSRKLAQQTIRDVYNATEGMDDEMFEDAAEMVATLGKMMKRGLSRSGTPSTMSKSATPGTPKRQFEGRPPALPTSGMVNPI
jgi:hypothetical protein